MIRYPYMTQFRSNLRRSILVCLTVVLSAAPVNDVIAIDFDVYSRENIPPFFDDNASTPSLGGCSGSSVSGETNIHKMWNYFVEKGLSNEQAAGILGNIQVESGFSATRQQDGMSFPNGGWGIVQWDSGSRRPLLVEALEEYDSNLAQYHDAKYGGATSEENGYVHPDIPLEDADKLLLFELDYLYAEAQTRKPVGGRGFTASNEWEEIKKATSVREASDVWLFSFERPADQSEGHAQDRADLGQKILESIGGDSSGLTASSSCTGNGSVSELQQLTLEYAYPEYHNPPFTDPMPAYKSAVDAAVAANKYTGSPSMPGIDCGAFTTLLLVNSGFDTTFNYGGGPGSGYTKVQEEWARNNWDSLNSGSPVDTSALEPGDVAFVPGHTWVYVGEIEGFGNVTASASLNERAPMAGFEGLDTITFRGATYTPSWFSKKG